MLDIFSLGCFEGSWTLLQSGRQKHIKMELGNDRKENFPENHVVVKDQNRMLICDGGNIHNFDTSLS